MENFWNLYLDGIKFLVLLGLVVLTGVAAIFIVAALLQLIKLLFKIK